MSPVYIKTRTAKSGKRYVVYWRRGGRAFKEEYGGSFKTQKEAKTRRDLIAGELAAGRDPKVALEQLKKPPAPVEGLATQWDALIASRVDVGAKAIAQAKTSRMHWTRMLGADRDPATVTANDVIGGIAELCEKLAPATVSQYVSGLSQVLDFADVHPNPVKSPKVKLPSARTEEVNPPSTVEWKAVLAKLPTKQHLLGRLLECSGLRIGEALKLTWGDIDWVEERVRVSRVRTKTRSGQRWLPIPEELLDLIDALVPLEDRAARGRVFPGSYTAFRVALEGAVKLAGVPAFSPHDLRHRRISLWFAHGIDQIQVKTWAGHARASMSQDVYGHVMIDASKDEWRTFWLDRYATDRTRGARAEERN